MATYKKKPMKPQKKRVKTVKTEEIPMHSKPARSSTKRIKTADKPIKPKKEPIKVEKPKLKVIEGNKPFKSKKRFYIIACCAVFLFIVLIINFSLPNGIIEYVQNEAAKIGSGSGYPVTLDGGTVLDVKGKGNCYLVASSTDFEGYNASGKNIFTYQHGYENPIIKASSSRFMLYSQGKREYSIYNLNKKIISAEASNDILATAIANNGYYAIATKSDSYTSEVTVYNSKNDVVYKWFCSDYIISGVVLSPNGKTMAVSVFNAQNGVYTSKLYVLEYSSGDPVKLFEYNDKLIYSLQSYSNSGFYVIFENNMEFISWRKLVKTEHNFEKNIIFSRGDSANSLLVTCNNANSADNTISVFSSSGEKRFEFSFFGEITDIAISRKYIFILSGRSIYLYNIKGEKLQTAECNFGVEKIIPVGNFTIAAFAGNNISAIKIK